LEIDAEVDFKDVLGETYKFLRSLAPFGQEHAPPSFLAQNVEVTDLRQMGTEGQHMRLTLRQSGAKWDAVAFNLRWPEGLAMPENPTGQHSNIPLIDVVYIPEINNFNGRSTMQFRLLDLRASD
jgi:single-stranded-DNA-specific exonuclease